MQFSQAETLVQQTYRQAMREADTRRKDDAARKLAFFNDMQTPYILEQLAREHAEPERYHAVFVNVVKKIVKALATVYLQDATREVGSGTEQDKQIYAEIETTAQLPVKMKLANRYSKLCGTILLRPVWRNGQMDLDVLPPDVLDVATGDTPEDLTAVLVTTFNQSGRTDEVEYDLWTAETYQRLDYRGNVLTTEPNPYGQIPFIAIFSHAPTETFWLPGVADLMTIQDEINRRLTALSFTADLQGFGIPWTKGANKDGRAPDLRFGPGDYIGLPKDADFGFASPNAPISEMLNLVDFLMKQAAVSNGIPAASMSTQPTQESGISKVVGNSELEEQRRDDIALFAQYEQQLFSMFRTVWNVHNPQRPMSEAATLRVDFYDPKPVLSGYEQAKEWELLMDKGLISPVDIMVERNPDLNREEAKARLREIQAELKEFSYDSQEYTPNFGSFPGIPSDYNNSADPA